MLRDLPDEQAADLIEEISPEAAAAIVDELPPDEQADILADVDEQDAEEILNAMPHDDADQARELMQYDEDTAGGGCSGTARGRGRADGCARCGGAQREKNSFLRISGIVGGEEFRSMPLPQRSFSRLSWLTPNIALNIIAASVIAVYQETLQAAIALAVFLPIISDVSGCSGNQAVAVSIRELALGLIRPTEFTRIFWKESLVGLINGVVLGLLLGAVAYLWKANIYLSLVVAGALALNTILSVLLGGSGPLFLRKLRIDPALASGPFSPL